MMVQGPIRQSQFVNQDVGGKVFGCPKVVVVHVLVHLCHYKELRKHLQRFF